MPGGDHTGPMGRGAMTGRGMGFCGEPSNRNNNTSWGGGRRNGGRGRGGAGNGGNGGGMRRRNMSNAAGTPARDAELSYNSAEAQPVETPRVDAEKQMLAQQVQDLQAELADLKQQLNDSKKSEEE